MKRAFLDVHFVGRIDTLLFVCCEQIKQPTRFYFCHILKNIVLNEKH